MRDGSAAVMSPVVLTVAAMLAQQALSTMAALTVPVLAPPIGAELGIEPSLIGAFTLGLYGAATVSALAAGSVILRFGAMRVSQLCLLACAGGLAAAASGLLAAFVLAALLIGVGTGPSTPASSHLIARFAPPRIAPLVFSIKQTGVPAGGVLAGVLAPFFLGYLGWRGALAAAAALCLALALALQPIRPRFDADRLPDRRLSLGEVGATVRTVVGVPPLRELSFASFVYAGLQVSYFSFFVSYLVHDLGYPLRTAGLLLAAVQAAAVSARILWGWLAGWLVGPRRLLGMLGLAMAAAAALTGLFSPSWPVPAVLLVGLGFGVSGAAYQGVMLAEIARQAPGGEVGRMTGGVLFFTFAGLMLVPAGFGIVLGVTDSYRTGFFATALPALLAGLLFFRNMKARPL